MDTELILVLQAVVAALPASKRKLPQALLSTYVQKDPAIANSLGLGAEEKKEPTGPDFLVWSSGKPAEKLRGWSQLHQRLGVSANTLRVYISQGQGAFAKLAGNVTGIPEPVLVHRTDATLGAIALARHDYELAKLRLQRRIERTNRKERRAPDGSTAEGLPGPAPNRMPRTEAKLAPDPTPKRSRRF
jgi:hypothetical protein